MLRCVAALCFAASIVGWPAYAGSDTDTFWSTPSAAVLAAWAPAAPALTLSPAPQAVAVAADAKADEPADDKTETQIENPAHAQNPIHADASRHIAALDPLPPAPQSPPISEPFGVATAPIAFGGIVAKWNGVREKIHADNEVLADCRDNMQICPQAAQNFLSIVAQGRALTGRARIGVINRAVNMAIEPMSDMAQWGVPDRWSDPLETFTTGRGDCEDYAIAKYVALTAAGVPAQDVKLVVVRNTAAAEDHAVVAVRYDGNWVMLDNRWLTMVDDVEMPKAIPLFVLDEGGVREFVSPTLTVARQTAAPASVGF